MLLEETNDILSSINALCKTEDSALKNIFSKYLQLTVINDKDGKELMNTLSELLFSTKYTKIIVKYFSKYVLQFLSIEIPLNDKKAHPLNYNVHLKNCVVLSILAQSHPDAKSFMLKYFEKYPSPFDKNYFKNVENFGTPAKKRKTNIEDEHTSTEFSVVDACYSFLKVSSDFFRSKWNWSTFIEKYFEHEEIIVKWICCQCIAILTGMNENQLNSLLAKKLSIEDIHKCTIEYDQIVTARQLELHVTKTECSSNISTLSISKNVISIAGILLPIYQQNPDKTQKNLVQVDSTRSNLRKVALGIASNRAVCLQGPVGSSKTTLVEYLAEVTGRKIGESFIKVQLGDQTDSKMLLGTYRCTDIPGEFVWQLGVLTQAVTEGCWLLLEDIDSASMDIATVITSLLENGYLTVPGYRDTVPIKPGFQLFVTQRLLSGISGYYKKNSNANNLLEKHMLTVNIEALSPEELVQIIKEIYPSLSTIASRMVDVFLLFSEGHDKNGVMIPTTGRLMSTRDLFKWCSRAIIDFDITSPNSALKVLQDAIDTFCCSLPKPEDRLRLSKEICAGLGIIETKAEYFCNNYKPNVSLTSSNLQSGRGIINRDTESIQNVTISKFSFTRPSSCLLERIICCVNLKEPVLLVGETGTGKTSSIQYLASVIGQKLIVINMNQQSDSADLLGGYKPVDLKYIITPIKLEFELLFRAFFSVQHNQKFLQHVANCFNQQKWSTLLVIMKHSQVAAIKRLQKDPPNDQNFLERWTELGIKLNKLTVQLKQQNALAFAFIEGKLVKAIENGLWVLLDEINLATAETLECLSGLLEGSNRSLSLLERGDRKPVERHEKFTLFACMNPSTDVGKKDLPAGLRNRFTEFFVEELTDKNDLLLLVGTYLKDVAIKQSKIDAIVKFYLTIRKEAQASLSDGSGHAPHYSLRTLCRALMISTKNNCGTVDRNLYEAFCLSFLTQLDSSSYKIVEQLIAKIIIGKEIKSVLNQPIPEPKSDSVNNYVNFEGYWVSQGSLVPEVPKEYILTESVRRNLKDLVRVVSIGKLPVLLQGDTSVGKTSLITYLAKASGNKCVRINNHEHTDLQEYIGSYIADLEGKLVFREGVLVEAMRKGHWIILDELNLAPTDVLEALNRVLDDNRELFIPETQETVKAHPNFMLFATQNPPGAYGGRKMLSRAFRNRFVELHFNEIPPSELETILHRRCEIPPSYCKKMIAVMNDLQTRRRGSAAFAGKQGFITLRDLFRWGERYRLAPTTAKLYDWDQHIADEGYLVLAGRVRKTEERHEIIEVLTKHIKRTVNPYNLFSLHEKTSTVTKRILEKIYEKKHLYQNIVWTFNTRQLAVLVSKALEFSEPVLLVGETGGGKTTVCQLIAENNGQQLITVNCHMHTESSDFIGGLRPVRDHSDDKKNKLFEWVDGPLIQAMQKGDVFLADEISLADDSVLERLNSLLEPERTLLLAEKGTDLLSSKDSESIKAHENFYFIGTMNPGGDFGKKELSPALRNRFTEIWCEACTDRNDLIDIIEQNLKHGLSFGNQEDCTSGIGRSIMDFIDWFKLSEIGKRFTVSIRDILTWVNFINATSNKIEIGEAYLHGACLTFLDSFGSGVTGSENQESLKKLRDDCTDFLIKQVVQNGLNPISLDFKSLNVEETEKYFGIKPFLIEKGTHSVKKENFVFNAPTTIFNALRLLRGLQLNKAILLEGSPGVGKTSLVNALAKATNHKLLRINLSDQTDICDLFGADLPVEGGQGGQFAWRDGPFLQALKNGDWIVLDELNLASQSVLEGLNACLDHRGEIFIPELGKTFYVKPGTKLFACQNPLRQGGSRRGLPKSFLNRFTQVFVETLSDNDLSIILGQQFPEIPNEIREKMIEFNKDIVSQTERYIFGYKGAPWEFNLRDLTRWCEILKYDFELGNKIRPEATVQLIYGDRMRTQSDKQKIYEIFESIFKTEVAGQNIVPYVTSDYVHMGDVKLSKKNAKNINLSILKQDSTCLLLRNQFETLRSLIYCVNLNWMVILAGNGACGKSNIVKTLSQLSGQELRTFSVNSAMDTMDILGGFEQVDYNRHLEELSEKIERLLLRIIQKTVLKDKNIKNSTSLFELWEVYKNFCNKETEGTYTMADATKYFEKRLLKLKNVVKTLNSHPNVTQKELLSDLIQKLNILKQNVEIEGTLNAGGKFEWVDSVLIKCLQDGCWLLIDNVNLCSPAVLDRLNALLEPNGILTIGERGVDSAGEMITIKPHPNFRLFLTMDPKNGEISRAMRNRGVEIYMLNETERENRNEYDIKGMIAQNGITNESFQNVLLKVHDFISENVLGEKPSISHILQAAFLISQQLLRGLDLHETFCSTIIDVYVISRSAHDFKFNDPLTEIKEMVISTLKANTGDKITTGDHKTLKTMELQKNCNFELVKQQTVLLSQEKPLEKILLCYDITSAKNLYLRYLYIKNNYFDADINCELYSKLECYLKKIGSKELLVDNRWINLELATRETISNQIFLLMYFTALRVTQLKAVDESPRKKYNKFSILQYSREVSKKNISHLSISEPLIVNFFSLLMEFDNFLLNLLENVELSFQNDDTIHSILILNWRVALQKFGETIIYNKKEPINIEDILSTLVVNYKWFLKNTVNYFKKFEQSKQYIAFWKFVETINNSIGSNLSIFKKIAKRYHKKAERPLPHTNEKEIERTQKYLEVVKKVSLATKNLEDFKINVRLALNNPEMKLRLFETKTNENVVLTLEDFVVKDIELTQIQLIPINDVLSLYSISNLRNNFVYSNSFDFEAIKMLSKNISLPNKLYVSLHNLNDRATVSFYELSSNIASYLTHAVALNPTKYLHFDKINEESFSETNLLLHTPALSYNVSQVCVDFEAKNLIVMVNLGSFKAKRDQFRYLNELLWHNGSSFKEEKFDLITNDLKYVMKSFKNFVEIFSSSQNITSGQLLCEKIDACIEKMNKSYCNADESRLMITYKDNFINFLNDCKIELKELTTTKDETKLTVHVANMYCRLNYCQALLNIQLEIIDPLQKNVLKKKYCEEEREICERFKRSFIEINDIYSGNPKTLHCYTKILETRISNYQQTVEKLSQMVAVRPKNQLYTNLIKDVSHSLSTLLSEDFFVLIFNNLNRDIKEIMVAIDEKSKINLSIYDKTLNQAKNWINSQENMLEKIMQYRVGYPDIIEPILSNITELSYGIRLLYSTLHKLIVQYEFSEYDLSVFTSNLIRFPLVLERENPLSYVKLFTKIKTQKLLTKLFKDNEFPNLEREEINRLFKCSLQELYNIFVISSPNYVSPTNDLVKQLNILINAFVVTWNRQEDDKRRKLEEENQLYKMKTKCETLTDEQQALKEMKELFQNFHDKDFSDFQLQTLDSETIQYEEVESDLGQITEEDVQFVYDLHSELMLFITKTEWLNLKRSKLEPDFVTPFLQRFKTFALIMQKKVNAFSYGLDKNLVNSLNLLISICESYGEGDNKFAINSSDSPSKHKKSFDFYHDSKIEEVKTCVDILNNLNQRISELLAEWPNHPTLVSIKTVLDRIYSFSITSPIARFLTGLEILLSKCHEWEENAHVGVTLAEHSEKITLQIISWRKLELSYWKDSLNKAHERIRKSVTKWWFHLYLSIQEFLDDNSQITPQKVIEILKQFIESSTLGEFEDRLNLLFVFHCHVVHLPKSLKSDTIISILWNLHSYYKQFLTNVNTKIKELRAPIEKKLRDFVKIARWNDINYWSVKETVEKTHRTLHKHIKEFETVLKESVKVCLVHSSGLESPQENVGIWDRPQRHVPSKHHYTMVTSNYLSNPKNKTFDETKNDSALLDRSEKYFTKSRNLCRDIISSTKYPNLIQNLDSFVTEVIETSSNLKNLEVNQGLPKNKQKSQAKSILQQKRKALADLFKTLTTLGVSYRTGLIESKLRENNCSELFLRPIDLKASFDQMKVKSASTLQLLNVWDGCETYFIRTISRFAALQSALKQPAPDLGLQNIERCKGFAAHLTILGENQKRRLIETSRDLFYLKHCATHLVDFNQDLKCLKSETVDQIYELTTNVKSVMKQIEILLQSCPEQPNFASDHKEIPLLDGSVSYSIKYKGDENWNNTLSEIKLVTNAAQKIKTYLDKHQHVLPNAEEMLKKPKLAWFPDLLLLKTNFETLSTKISQIKTCFGNSGIGDSLICLLEEIESLEQVLEVVEPHETNQKSIGAFKTNVENLTETILLVIQSLFKKYKEMQTNESVEKSVVKDKPEENGEAEEDVNDDFVENHLRVAVIQNLFDDLASLQTNKILSKVFEVINALSDMNPSETKISYQILTNSLPLLEQIVLVYEYFITQQVASYRVTCKLNSILLNIFTELATSGFCVPPELSDEMGPEGQTKQQNGMGLGDGEGERDVSDRIENEDQLDDAQPAGQEKKKEEDKDCKEEDKGIEMSEDFDSKLQDINQPDDDDDQSQSDNDDADKQMGETEPNSDKLDEQIWGSDDEETPEEEESKETKEERGDGGEVEDQKMAAKEDNSNKNEEEENDPSSKDKKKEQEKDINEMDEPEIDDEQIDPYHGKHPQMPEPEELDLPDDLQLDDGEEKEEAPEENPFDIDTMKEQMPNIPDEPENEDSSEQKDENKPQDDSSDDEDGDQSQENNQTQMDTDQPEDPENAQQDEEKQDISNDIKKSDEKVEDESEDTNKEEESGLDPEPSAEDLIQPMEIENTDNSDNVQTNPNQNDNQQSDQISQEESLDKDGVGQSQMEESESGHKGQANANKQSKNKQKEIDEKQKRHRPGEADSNRSLGETNEPVKKRLKTVNIQDKENEEEGEEDEGAEEGVDADMYQHIKEAKETDTQVLDAATKEQAESQKIQDIDETKEDEKIDENEIEMADDEPEPEINDVPNQKSEKTEKTDSKKPDKKQTDGNNGDVVEEIKDVEIEGDIVDTMNVERGTDSSYHTQYDIASEIIVARLSSSQIVDLRNELENQLASWNEPPPSMEAEKTWEKFSAVTSSLARDLSEQLRLVLEPTQASRLRGDFKTGRRINMRKVIPYIASQFRKDKIWLRRTKPSKREYQIVLAIDDSSSMDDNHSKELAFESVALISKALSLLESGQLSILSFGEQTEILHKLSDTFSEKSGVKLLQKFTFQQKKTCVANLVDFVTNMFSDVHTTALHAKLLVIVSDGRGIFSEGEAVIQQAIRRAKFADIFMVFVILDNPENKNSILDIRMPVFKDGKLLGIKSYLDSFPFPFYIILRDINNLPNVLSDALRQWFELVTNKDG